MMPATPYQGIDRYLRLIDQSLPLWSICTGHSELSDHRNIGLKLKDNHYETDQFLGGCRCTNPKTQSHSGEENMVNPILVTGAAGRVGGIGRRVTELLLKQGQAVRAM